MHAQLRHHRPLTAAIVGLAVGACAGGRVPGASPAAEGCRFAAEASAPGGPDAAMIVVGVAGPVDPARAPYPTTEAERSVFAHFYETLVRETCDGRTEGLLAESWRAEDGGRTWTFKLRSDVRDWAGERVSAADVVAAWGATAPGRAAGPDATLLDPGPRPGETPAFLRLSARDAHTVQVELAAPVTVGYFARPELAVVTRHVASAWPVGTGPYRPAGDATQAGPTRRLPALPTRGAAPLEFRALDTDARNALDTGVDVLVTDDPAVIAYAAGAPSFEALSLPWDRSYVLAVPRAATDPAASEFSQVHFFPALSAGLARDAVRGDARTPERPLPDATTCAVPSSVTDGSGAGAGIPRMVGARAEARIVYAQGDATARALAERVVALTLPAAGTGAAELREAVPELAHGGRVRALGLAAPEFARSLQAGEETAYVLVGAGTASNGGCATLTTLLRQAPWLTGAAPVGEASAIVSLIETRRTLVLRRGVRGVELDGSGRLLLHRARRGGAAEGRARLLPDRRGAR